MTFKEIQDEVLRRSVRDQGGSQYVTAVKACINTSLLRIAREASWKPLRRKTTLTTVGPYSTGSGTGTFTKNSTTITVSGATFITDGVQVGRYIKLSGDGKYHTIQTITGETTLTLERAYSGTSTTTGTYQIFGQETYSLPLQVGNRMFMWHNEYGFPIQMEYVLDQDFYRSTTYVYIQQIPLMYRMWGDDMAINPIRQPSVIAVTSSSALDKSISVNIFGMVSGYPDSETVTTNATDGTASVYTTKTFQSIERVVKNASTVGRITATANDAADTVTVIPAGDVTYGTQLKKIQIWPLPTTSFPINVQYYKEPYILVNDNDVHEFGIDFDEAIILLATAKVRLDNNQEEADKYFTLYKDEIANLRRTNVDKIDWFPKLERPWKHDNLISGRGLSYLQVGPWFGNSSRI